MKKDSKTTEKAIQTAKHLFMMLSELKKDTGVDYLEAVTEVMQTNLVDESIVRTVLDGKC